MLTSLTLAAVVLLAASVVAVRVVPESRAGSWLAAMVLWISVVHGTVHVLGWLDVLYRPALAAALASVSAVLAAAAFHGTDRAVLAARLVRHLRLPVDALRETWSARSPAFIAVAYVAAVLLWSGALVVLAPTGTWDGLWYHEPMVGFALQSHGFANVEVPPHLEMVNGYPRLSENLMLFFSAFGDRVLIDAVPHVMLVTSLLATHCFARRFTPRTDHALAAACVLVTMPGVVLQLRSTYVDVAVLATFVAAIHYASSPRFGRRDLYLAALCLGLVGGTKSTGLVYLGLIGTWALVRAVRQTRPLGGRFALHALVAAALCLALVLPTFVRNALDHDNPIWPLRYEIGALGLRLAGPIDIQNMQLPFEAVMGELFGFPIANQDYPDTRHHGYGYGPTYLGIPLTLLSLVVLVGRWARRQTAPTGLSLGPLLLAFLLGLLTLLSSPAFYWARYALPLPAFALVLIAAFGAWRPRGVDVGAAFFAMLLSNAILLAWASPRWDVTFAQAVELWELRAEERPYADTSPLLLSESARRWRDEHVGPGEVVAFDDQEPFIASLWNESFTNRVRYVPYDSPDRYLAALDDAGAIWVMCRRGGSEDRALAGSSAWTFQGTEIVETQLYRRAPSGPPSWEGPAVRSDSW